ncbi:hypothetical protein SESBI_28921 [Sesbania bispinosa]|nr:hypothetical protein SESBI_28921 [Sesbania bispinosa]
MAKAKRIQAHTSLMSADERASLPNSVLTSLSSARILARTGKSSDRESNTKEENFSTLLYPSPPQPRRENKGDQHLPLFSITITLLRGKIAVANFSF